MTLAELLSALGAASTAVDSSSQFQQNDSVIFELMDGSQHALTSIQRIGTVQTTVPGGVAIEGPKVVIKIQG